MSIRWRLASVCLALVVATAATTALVTRAAAQREWVWVAVAAALMLGLPAVLSAVWLGRDVDDAVADAVADAEAIAAGDLAVEPRPLPGPLGRLPDAIGRLTRSVADVFAGIRRVAVRLGSAGAGAGAAAERQAAACRGLDEALADVGGVASRLATAGTQLLQTTGGLVDVARAATRAAVDGRGGLERMRASMGQLEEALDAFVRKLATISQRASGITAVVTTIAKVAEQTNLLSVNATIEAEKAGESGRGFRIVAQEIRRLADQTALATKDIERMVRDMQAAVTGGTMEMDRFRGEVSGRMADVADVSEKLARIVEPVQAVTRSLEQVHEGMEAQAGHSRRILDAVPGLRARADDLAAAAAACAAAVDAVRKAAAELDAETAALVLPEFEEAGVPS